MPAIRSDSSLAPVMGMTTISQNAYVEGIKTAFSQAGYSAPIDDYTVSTDRFLVYQLVFDQAKNFGTVFLHIKIAANLGIAQRLYTSWTVSSHTGSNPGPEAGGSTVSATAAISFMGLTKKPEYQLVMIYQGSITTALGYVRPEFKPDWWDENTYPFCFLPAFTSTSQHTLYMSGLTPYTGTLTTSARVTASSGVTQLSGVNPVTAKRDIAPGLLYFAHSNEGIAGRSSTDFAMVSATGLARQDIIQVVPGQEEYILLAAGNGSPAVRVV